MNDKILTVWDCEETATSPAESTIYWSGYSKKGNISTVPLYLEQNADKLRARYLAFIHELGELNVSGKMLLDHLNIDENFSFWWMTLIAEKNHNKSSRIFDCLRLLALDDKLEKINPHTLRLVSDDSILARSIKKCSVSKGIHFQWDRVVSSEKKMDIKFLLRKLPSYVNAVYSFLVYIITRWRLVSFRRKKWFSGKNSIFIFSYFVHLDSDSCEKKKFLSHQWGILPSILKNKGIKLNFIHHFLQSPIVPNASKGLQLVKSFNQESASKELHSFLDNWLSLKVCFGAIYDFLKISIKMSILKPAMIKSLQKIRYNYLWVLLEKDWNNSIHGNIAIRNTLSFRLMNSAIGSLPKQPIGLYLNEGQPWERAFIHYWRKYGHGRLIGYNHATVAFWYLMYFNDLKTLNSNTRNSMPQPDFISVNGKSMRNIMENSGCQPEALINVEALRYVHLSQTINKSKSNLSTKDKNKLLVLGDYMQNVTKSTLSLLDQLDESIISKYNIILKNHPAVKPVDTNLFFNIHIQETNLLLTKILNSVDVVIATINTAAAIESFATGLPVITVLDGNNFNASPLRGENGAMFVSNKEELSEALFNVSFKTGFNKKHNFFWTDPKLPRWQTLIEKQ